MNFPPVATVPFLSPLLLENQMCEGNFPALARADPEVSDLYFLIKRCYFKLIPSFLWPPKL